ncbi:MAG: hypothetical protein K2J32_07035 [Ruminococcus sp.]|nr:hypothetical protein [Ruminococcus sp.]
MKIDLCAIDVTISETWQYLTGSLNSKRQVMLMNMEQEIELPVLDKDVSAYSSLSFVNQIK